MTIEIHEAALIFPLDEESIPELADDIRHNGLLIPVERLDGKVIDGRRRLRACELAKVQPKFRDVSIVDPISYVLSLNLKRRMLTPSQRAMVGARAREMYDMQAKERQRVRKGKQPGATPVKVPDLSEGNGDARELVGRTVGVSGKTIDQARTVLTKGTKELVDAVDGDLIAVSTAAKAAIRSKEEQEALVDRAKEAKSNGHKPRRRPAADMPPEGDEPAEIKVKGVGVYRANEAINSLTRIPKNDPLRQQGLKLVTDWIKRNR